MSFNEKEVTYKKQMVIQRNSDLIKKKLLATAVPGLGFGVWVISSRLPPLTSDVG